MRAPQLGNRARPGWQGETARPGSVPHIQTRNGNAISPLDPPREYPGPIAVQWSFSMKTMLVLSALALSLATARAQLFSPESFHGAAFGALVGAIAGGHHHAGEGAAIGAGAGFLFGALSSETQRRRSHAGPLQTWSVPVYVAPSAAAPVAPAQARSQPAPSDRISVAPPASSMAAANTLFGR